MDQDFKDQTQKKHKKKKHHRSRSRSEHKQHKRSRSRSQNRKDKKKKQKSSHDRHHQHHSPSRDNSRTQKQNKQQQLARSTEKIQPQITELSLKTSKLQDKDIKEPKDDLKSKHFDDDKDRAKDHKKDNDRDERKSGDRLKEKNRKQRDHRDKDYKQRDNKDYKERDRKQRDKQKDHKERDEKSKQHKEKSYKQRDHQSKQKQAQALKKDKSVDKNDRQYRQKRQDLQRRQKHRQHQRSYEKDRHRQTSRYDRYDNSNRYNSKRRERQRQTFRSRSRSNDRKQRSPQRNDRYGSKRRSRSKDKQTRNDRWRGQKRRENNRFDAGRFRFDSPPKSDESDMSDDPEKMQKLNRMKAEKELVTSKADRKLYLGNLPPNITSQQLMDMLNAALKKMEINTDIEGDSIISAWISPDGVGHYAFVQFRTAQQGTNGLALNGASLFGYQLKLGRPKQYIEYNKQLLSKFGTDSSIDTIIKKVQAMGGEITIEVTEKIICPPTRILILKHIVTVEQLGIDEQYQQIYDDVLDMAKRYGDVIKVTIPRPHEVFDLEEVRTRVKGLGYIFVEYKTVEQAIFARKQFVQKQFSGRSVACSFFNQKRFREGQYDVVQKVIIDF